MDFKPSISEKFLDLFYKEIECDLTSHADKIEILYSSRTPLKTKQRLSKINPYTYILCNPQQNQKF